MRPDQFPDKRAGYSCDRGHTSHAPWAVIYDSETGQVDKTLCWPHWFSHLASEIRAFFSANFPEVIRRG